MSDSGATTTVRARAIREVAYPTDAEKAESDRMSRAASDVLVPDL